MTGIFLEAVNRSIVAGWLVLAAVVLRFILKKAPKWTRLLLWGMVALRLIFPVTIESRFSLIPDAEPLTEGFLGAFCGAAFSGDETEEKRNFPDEKGIPVKKDQIGIPGNEVPESGTQGNGMPGSEGLDGIQGNVVPGNTALENGAQGSGVRGNALAGNRFSALRQNWYLVAVLAVVWLSGAGLLLFYALFRYLGLRRQVSTAIRLRDNIFRSGRVDSPFVLGIVKPRIYIPSSMEESRLELVILHEQTHIRRGDHWWKLLGFGLLSLYWFHPLMWLAYVLLCRDIELACDERVIRGLDRERRADYSQTLLDCSVRRRGIRPCPLAFGASGVKARVKSVLNYRKPGFWAMLAAVAACGAAAVCFLTNPVNPALRDTLVWAQTLEAGEIAEADLVIFPRLPDKQYKRLSENDIARMVSLINRSRGSYIAEHEELNGGSTFFYLTMTDGSTHEVGNIGNTYLVIDGDYFEGGRWLSAWDDTFPEGDEPLPEGYFQRQLTLEDVLELAKKGEALSWADFEQFRYEDIGSGLFVYRHEIDETFDLLIGGGDAREARGEPLYIMLRAKPAPGWAVWDSVDIRTEDAAAFIRKHQDPQALAEAVIWKEADLDRDGEPELIRVRETAKEEAYLLEVIKQDGTLLWSEEAGTSHAGWNTLLLYQERGEDYLVRYQPDLSQGYGSYTCEMFYLAGGEEMPENSWAADFELATGEITGKMRAFAERATQFLKEGTVLLSTQGGSLAVGPWKAEDLSWLYPLRFYPDGWQAESAWTDFAAGMSEDTAPLEFEFASGAGGWGTSLTLYPDGTFQGVYESWEPGTEKYPNGITHICRFSGRFEDITKTGEYTCSMRLAELNCETEAGREWISNGTRYIGAQAYGLEEGKEFIFYLPGAPMAELEEAFMNWSPDRFLWREGGIDRLGSYGIYNVEAGYGFFTNWFR